MPAGRSAMTYAMSRAEREQFLARPHVGVLSVVENGAPLMVPIWYGYQPGGQVIVITGRESRKARAVRAAGWLGLCAQDEAWPYKYVTASGPAAISARRALPSSVPWPAGILGMVGVITSWPGARPRGARARRSCARR